MDDLPPIPEFLKSANRPKARPLARPEDKWKVPQARETRTSRRKQKEKHDIMVHAAVKSGADTFGKIRKELPDDLQTNHIQNSLRRLCKDRRIRKNGRRYHPS